MHHKPYIPNVEAALNPEQGTPFKGLAAAKPAGSGPSSTRADSAACSTSLGGGLFHGRSLARGICCLRIYAHTCERFPCSRTGLGLGIGVHVRSL